MLRRWLDSGETLAMSAVAWAEFLCGPIADDLVVLATSVVRERVVFHESHSALAAELFNETGHRRGTVVDCMIAATAIAENAPVATMNVDDFDRFVALGLA